MCHILISLTTFWPKCYFSSSFFFLSCHEFTNTICSLFLLSGNRLYVSTCQTFYTSVLNDPVSPQLGCFCTSILTRNPCVSERPLTFKYAWIFCHGCRCRRGFLRLHCVSLSSSRPLFFCTVVQLAHTHTHVQVLLQDLISPLPVLDLSYAAQRRPTQILSYSHNLKESAFLLVGCFSKSGPSVLMMTYEDISASYWMTD